MTEHELSTRHMALLRQLMGAERAVELAVLIGSRATGRATADSDWDIAIRLRPGDSFMESLGKFEDMRRQCAAVLHVNESSIDLIDLRTARLTMKAVVAEEGIPLCGDDTLTWCHFLLRTWRELEDYYWEKSHAA